MFNDETEEQKARADLINIFLSQLEMQEGPLKHSVAYVFLETIYETFPYFHTLKIIKSRHYSEQLDLISFLAINGVKRVLTRLLSDEKLGVEVKNEHIVFASEHKHFDVVQILLDQLERQKVKTTNCPESQKLRLSNELHSLKY